jgi:hypothetical protein
VGRGFVSPLGGILSVGCTVLLVAGCDDLQSAVGQETRTDSHHFGACFSHGAPIFFIGASRQGLKGIDR